MENLNFLEVSELVDLLVEESTKYSHLRVEGGDEAEFEKCKLAITEIQKEIGFRINNHVINIAVPGDN